MKIKFILTVISFLFVSSCSEGINGKDASYAFKSVTISSEQYAVAKNLSNVAVNKKEGFYKLFLDRSKIADALLSNELKNSNVINIKLRETKNTIVMQQYFKAYLDKVVTQELVTKYYTENKDEFDGISKSQSQIYSSINYKLRSDAHAKEYQRLLGMARK